MTSKRNKKNTGSPPKALAIGMVAGILTIIGGAAIGAIMIAHEWISNDTIMIVKIAITFLGAAVGGLVTSSVAGQKKLQICLLYGAILLVILFACNAMFFDGQYSGIGSTIIAIFAGVIAAVAPGIRQGGGRKKCHGKKAYR